MTPRVVPILSGLRWDPNEPNATLVVDDRGFAALVLRPHMDDLDPRLVVLFWTGVLNASLSQLNDEGRHAHRHYGHGLSDVLWVGELLDDPGVTPPLRTFIVPTKEAVAEVVARTISHARLDSAVDASVVLRMLVGNGYSLG